MNEWMEFGKMAVSAAGGVAGMCAMQWWQRRKTAAEAEQLEINIDTARLEFQKKLNARLTELENEVLTLRTEVLQLKAEKVLLMEKMDGVQARLDECEARSKAAASAAVP